MRIAFLHYRFTPNPDYVDLAQKLRDRGHFVLFGERDEKNDLSWDDGQGVAATVRGQRPVPKLIKKVPLLPGIWNRLAYLAFIWRIRHFLIQNDMDVIQILPPPYFPQAFPILMRGHTRSVLAIKQMNLGVQPGFVPKVRDWLLSTSRGLSSRYFYDHTVFDYYLTAKAVLGPRWQEWATAIPLGLNPRLFAIQVRPPNLDPQQPVRFLYVGKISRFRQLERVIEAAAFAARSNDGFVIDIIGPDHADGYYQDLIGQLGVNQLVCIKPPVPYETIPDLMATYDVGLAYNPDYLTWHYQPTIKILEYRAAGLPILSTDVTAHRDIVRDDLTGVLVKDDVPSVAAGLLKFVENRDFLQRCFQNAQRNREGLTAEEVARRHEQVYTKVLSRNL